jgi:hypothetical protein
MKHLINFFKIFLVILFSFEIAIGCTCQNKFTPPCAAYSDANVVFVGVVQRVSQPFKTNKNVLVTANLIVEQSFKGNRDKQIEVNFPIGDCGYEEVKLGKKYFIYAHSKTGQGRLEVDTCSRTTVLEKANDDLKYVNSMRQRKEHPLIMGRILDLTNYEKVKVVVEAEKETKESFVNSDGTYKFMSFGESNEYVVRLLFPFEVTSRIFELDYCPPQSGFKTCIEYTVEARNYGCSYLELPLNEVSY